VSPVVSGGIGSLSRQTGETTAGFKARQDAARAFTTRQQNLAGLAPKDCKSRCITKTSTRFSTTAGVGSFQPFLTAAQQH
jgi:hypothetical protein